MSKLNPSLKIRFDGGAVEPGEIRVSHLLIFLTCLNKALRRTARLLLGDTNSVRPGQPPRTIRKAVELSLVSLTQNGLDRIRRRIEQPQQTMASIGYPESRGGPNITTRAIGRIEDRRGDAVYLPSRETAKLQSFWESPSLEDLAHSQNVQPVPDVRALFGTWPGEEDDGFEAAIDELRHPDSKQDVRS